MWLGVWSSFEYESSPQFLKPVEEFDKWISSVNKYDVSEGSYLGWIEPVGVRNESEDELENTDYSDSF